MMEEVTYKLPHDDSNADVIDKKKLKKPKKSAKVDSRGSAIKQKPTKLLSKKQKKKLEKTVERKEKQAKRKELYEQLSKFQLSKEELTSLRNGSTLNNKIEKSPISRTSKVPSTIAGCKRKASRELKAGIQSISSSDASEESSSDNESEGEKNDSTTEHGTNQLDQSKKRKTEEETDAFVQSGEGLAKVVTKPDEDVVVLASVNEENLTKPDAPEPQCRPVANVPVIRSEHIQKSREALPIIGDEQVIVEAVNEHPVVIICGETGSGKTTQVPQFLYEAGYTQIPGSENIRRIGITEPRRVAAMSMAARVGEEMSLGGNIVSYQIRYEGNASEQTEMLFMTDGVLLKEIQKDFLLSKYSVIIIDEAHERSMFSDILIGLLSRIILLRKKRNDPLKLIIMSATLKVEDFTQPHLFTVPPRVLSVDSRQFPVTIYFNRITNEDYLGEAYKKVCKVHNLLPEGSILVFVSGQQEVTTLIRWLKQTFSLSKAGNHSQNSATGGKSLRKVKESGKRGLWNEVGKREKKKSIDLSEYNIQDLIKRAPSAEKQDEVDFLDYDSDWALESGDEGAELRETGSIGSSSVPLHCLPLYSLLPSSEQRLVFEPPPPGSRLCVVATNVAETSITIPGVKYVIDTGKEKIRAYDSITSTSKFSVEWISKASANQRAGRAGRTGPGHCYRLYSSAVFNEFAPYPIPEIKNKPMDDLVLTMKRMHILKVRNFPFPSALDVESLRHSEQKLVKLGALTFHQDGDRSQDDAADPDKRHAKITDLGRLMAEFPVIPQFAKILALAHQANLAEYAILIVSAISVRELLINLSHLKASDTAKATRFYKLRKGWASMGDSNALGDYGVLMRALAAAEYAVSKGHCLLKFCQDHGLRYKALVEARKLRRQLTAIYNGVIESAQISPAILDPTLPLPTPEQVTKLRQLILAGLAENVAKLGEINEEGGSKKKKGYFAASGISKPIFIHPESVLAKADPEWIVYFHISEASNEKMFANTVMCINQEWLPVVAEGFCVFGEVVPESGHYDFDRDCVMCKRDSTFGLPAWKIPAVFVKSPLNVDLYRHLAAAFLDGSMFGQLVKYRKALLASPSTVFKDWAQNKTRTSLLLSRFLAENIQSRSQILDKWEKGNQTFLCDEYCNWLPEALHGEVQLNWPPIPK